MANIKSARKRIKQTAKKRARSQTRTSRLRTAIKNYRSLEPEARAAALPGTHSQIDRALRKGTLHRNAAARQKSRLAKKTKARKP
jgi:small subunit ribosomal protein S20